MAICGIDSGSLNSMNYVAWIESNAILFDVYVPTVDHPLPSLPDRFTGATHFALDCPQSLPRFGETIRLADKLACTPTKRLPQTRQELEHWKPYGGLVRCGVTVFWSVYTNRIGSIPGLTNGITKQTVMETYPRYVLKRLWPDVDIPSKTKKPVDYVNLFWPKILALGFVCDSVQRPTVDQLDSAICAVVADRFSKYSGTLPGTVGTSPIVDAEDGVLREGFIVGP